MWYSKYTKNYTNERGFKLKEHITVTLYKDGIPIETNTYESLLGIGFTESPVSGKTFEVTSTMFQIGKTYQELTTSTKNPVSYSVPRLLYGVAKMKLSDYAYVTPNNRLIYVAHMKDNFNNEPAQTENVVDSFFLNAGLIVGEDTLDPDKVRITLVGSFTPSLFKAMGSQIQGMLANIDREDAAAFLEGLFEGEVK